MPELSSEIFDLTEVTGKCVGGLPVAECVHTAMVIKEAEGFEPDYVIRDTGEMRRRQVFYKRLRTLVGRGKESHYIDNTCENCGGRCAAKFEMVGNKIVKGTVLRLEYETPDDFPDETARPSSPFVETS